MSIIKYQELIELIKSPCSEAEDRFRHNILMALLPVLIVIFLLIAYGLFPIAFGLESFFQVSNVKIIHVLLISLTIIYILGLKFGAEKISFLLPILLAGASIAGLNDDNIFNQTRFIPFYAGVVSIFFAFAFLKFKFMTIYCLIYLPTFLALGYFKDIAYSEFIHRSSIFFLLIPFAIAFSLARKKIFLDLKNKSDELLEMSNIQILGEISGGVAHEINNPLAIISGVATTVSKKIEKDSLDIEKLSYDMDIINDTVKRISKITSSLLNIAHKREDNKFELVDLKEVFTDSLSIFEESLKQKSIELETVLQSVHIECIPVQVMQIIVNLTSNSVDSIERTENPWIKISLVDKKDHALIHFIDSGTGITKEIESKLMNPFYTTKEPGKGSGLGLSICNRIAKSHNGSFKYLNENRNTTFEILLPKTQK